MKYTKEQAEWIKANASAKVWDNFPAFVETFNERFNETRSESALNTYMTRRKIEFTSTNGRWTKEQRQWVQDNVQAIEWRNTKHFADTFNAIFGTNKSKGTMNVYLNKNGLRIRSNHTQEHYTNEMNEWLVDNFEKYNRDFVSLAKDFNDAFGTDYSNCRLAKHCQNKLKIHKPNKKEAWRKSKTPRTKYTNKGQFKKGETNNRGLPVGTIRYNSDGRPFIKVRESDGRDGMLDERKGHNYKEPWWMPLQKKIWIDHFGEVPEGYRIVSLNGNSADTNIENIGLIDIRGTAVMAKKGWWTENRVITGDGVQWCNLYYLAKDKGVI